MGRAGRCRPRRAGDPKRDAITARFRELQAEERAKRAEAGNGDAPLAPPDDGDGEIEPAPADAAGEADSHTETDPELELLVYGNVYKLKRSELISRFDLEGFDDARIINIAQKQMAADQRLAEAKAEADQRLSRAGAQPSASEVGQGDLTDQSEEPRPDDADGLAPDRPPRAPDQALPEEQLDEIVQRVQSAPRSGAQHQASP